MLRIYVIFSLIMLVSFSSHARQSCDWPFRTAVNIQENSGNNLSNYQVKLTINGSRLDSRYNWSNAGIDLRIYDSNDSTPLEFWIDSWNATAKTATIWVKFPSSAPLIANANRNIFIYYGNPNAAALANAPFTFVQPGIKFHTRRATQNPNSYNNAISIFNNSNDNNNEYGCTFITSFEGITNTRTFGSRFAGGNNFIANSETYFEVKAGEGGNWGFRYGADFGWGGGLYVNNAPLDEKWNLDLWWGNLWTNTNEILQGAVTLSPGYHKLEVIGGEPGNDGGITVQYRKPGGDWATFSTGTIDIRSRACPVTEPTVTFGAHDVCTTDLQQSTTTPISNAWPVNSNQTISLRVNKNDSAVTGATPSTRTTITLPNVFTLNSITGTNWSCTGTGTIQCNYSQALTNGQPMSSVLTLNITASNATSGSSAAIIASVSSNLPDVNPNNNSVTINVNFLEEPDVPAACANPQPGLLASFFDISGYPTTNINNAAAFQALVDARANQTFLIGQTIVSRINKGSATSANIFNTGNNNNFLMVLKGYVFTSTRRDNNYFGIDGDDAVEVTVNGNIASAYYGIHGSANAPQDIGNLSSLPKGFSPIEFRLQEFTGNDAYFLYWSSSASNGYTLIPAANYFHCAGNTNIQLNSSVQVISDPINTANFKAIPGAELRHTVTANNLGNISTDSNSTILTQALDPKSNLFVDGLSNNSPIIFNDGSGNQASGLTYAFDTLASTTDSIAFSVNGTDFTYSPVVDADGYDANITHFRLNLNGTFKPTFSGITPNFNFVYQVKLD